MANKLPVYSKFESKTSGQGITDADQIDYGIFKQSVINEKLMSGKIYDAENKEWVSNTSELTEATIDTLGGIKIAHRRDGNTPTIQGGTDNVIGRLYGVELNKDGKAFVHVPWVQYALGTASHEILGGVMTGDNTGIKVEEQVIKADFDTDVYSAETITTHNFSTTKVASPDTVKKIFDAYNQVFLDTLGDVEAARLNLYNAIYGTDYTETSQIPVE